MSRHARLPNLVETEDEGLKNLSAWLGPEWAYPVVCGGRVPLSDKPGQLLACKGVNDIPGAPTNSINQSPKSSPRSGTGVISLGLPKPRSGPSHSWAPNPRHPRATIQDPNPPTTWSPANQLGCPPAPFPPAAPAPITLSAPRLRPRPRRQAQP